MVTYPALIKTFVSTTIEINETINKYINVSCGKVISIPIE